MVYCLERLSFCQMSSVAPLKGRMCPSRSPSPLLTRAGKFCFFFWTFSQTVRLTRSWQLLESVSSVSATSAQPPASDTSSPICDIPTPLPAKLSCQRRSGGGPITLGMKAYKLWKNRNFKIGRRTKPWDFLGPHQPCQQGLCLLLGCTFWALPSTCWMFRFAQIGSDKVPTRPELAGIGGAKTETCMAGLTQRSTYAPRSLQVGSFEEVMMRMTGSSGNELAAWSQVMFVAPNLLRQAVLKDDVTTAGK
eukprot:1160436-Pelagomonas_calceolata.AAC.24